MRGFIAPVLKIRRSGWERFLKLRSISMKKGITVVAFVAIASMSGAGVLSVDLVGSGPTNVNLTTEGTADWVMLGQGGGVARTDCLQLDQTGGW